MRHWADRSQPLELLGPPSALAQCRAWVGPDDPVRFRELVPGAEVTLVGRQGDYRVRALPAAHGRELGDAVLYDVTGATTRVLWATDTGPLPVDTHCALAGAGFDAVFLEETFGRHTEHGTDHHDLPAFAHTVAQLRESGALHDRTDVIAIHLSHFNPPGDDLARALGRCGARAGRDGEVIRAGTADLAVPMRQPPSRTLVLGGVRSGKSVHAEAMLAAEPRVIYLATGGRRDGDAEWADRIRRHRDRRSAHWQTVETSEVATKLRTAEAPVLVECLGTWLTARIDAHRAWDGATDGVFRDIDDLVHAWRQCAVPIVAVSNEVGGGVVPPTASGRLFRDLLGVLNTRIAAESDNVTLLVAGIPVPVR